MDLIVAHIKQNTICCNYWLWIAKNDQLWRKLDRWLIRLIYRLIFEYHWIQKWHDEIFNEIISISEPRIWRICIPSRYGKTYMANRLRKYASEVDQTPYVLVLDEHAKRDWEVQIGRSYHVIITCASKFGRQYTERMGIPVEYRELKL